MRVVRDLFITEKNPERQQKMTSSSGMIAKATMAVLIPFAYDMTIGIEPMAMMNRKMLWRMTAAC